MEDFIERLKTEKENLAEKITKLENFTLTDKYDNIDNIQQSLLDIQLSAMETYFKCLHHRLAYLQELE